MKYLHALTFFAVVGWTSTAQAVPFQYQIAMGETLGFEHSFLTDADTPIVFHPGFFSGAAQANMTGTLRGDLSATEFTISPSTLTLTGLGGPPIGGDIWSIEFTGGTLTLPPANFSNSGVLLGTMDYVIRDDLNAIFDTGSFYVFEFNFAGFANGINSDGIYIWANNWNNQTMTRQQFIDGGGLPLGIDIGGLGELDPVPEPSTWALAMMGIGTLVVGGRRRLRRKSVKQSRTTRD